MILTPAWKRNARTMKTPQFPLFPKDMARQKQSASMIITTLKVLSYFIAIAVDVLGLII